MELLIGILKSLKTVILLVKLKNTFEFINHSSLFMKTLQFTILFMFHVSVHFSQSLDTMSKEELIRFQSKKIDSIIENSSFKEKHFNFHQKEN